MPVICDICDEPILKKTTNGYTVYKCFYCQKSGCIDCIELCNFCNKNNCAECSLDVCPCCK
jgi:hypothetical protein